MGKSGMPPPAFIGAAEEQAKTSQANTAAQTAANRPNINTPFASQQWHQRPDGQWEMGVGFTGGMGQAANGLQGQMAGLSTPMDWGQFGQLQDGSAARDQAIDAAYGQATSRLDPAWNQREEQTRTRLLNQGLDSSSAAYQAEMANLLRDRNDAYGSAMNSAIGHGQAAGDSVFRNNIMGRQQAIAEALRQRGMPMAELQALQGFLAMPGFTGAGRADTTQYLPAVSGASGAQIQQQQQGADMVAGAGRMAGAFAGGF